MRIGVDAGGTFTDFIVFHDNGRVETFKLRSNPAAPASVILEGLDRAAGRTRADVVHGSTVGTNALLERKGARTALVTTAGFEDVIQIARQNRAELYNLTPAPRPQIVPRELRFGVEERVHFDGAIARRPEPRELAALAKKLQRARVESVAICFLHAYRTPDHEKLVAEALAGAGYQAVEGALADGRRNRQPHLASGYYISCSHDVCPEFREYERSSTTVINAYIGPLMDRYLGQLEGACKHRLSIMQSNGGFMPAAEARRHAVRTVLSGPAGGVIGALHMARLSGHTRILGFDMGGTSTDVSLCDGSPRETMEASVDGMPIRVPMLDIHTVGAGGGSIARVDEGGLLRVGPESAGADPGPACYGIGEQATVTDAHVVLGRIAPDQLVGGEMSLDVERAGRAVDVIARALRIDRIAAAAGIVRIANANMERAIRLVSVERGHDPRDFALVAFGGCGGLHACDIARELGIRTVIVPDYAGALSALGMLIADNVRDYAAGVLNRPDVEKAFRELERTARAEMRGAKQSRLADIRYAGQSYEITVPWNAADPGEAFHREHRRVYGYADPGRAIEIVTVRVRAVVEMQRPRRQTTKNDRLPHRDQLPHRKRRVYAEGRFQEIAVYPRERVSRLKGPALILDYGSTTLAPPGWSVQRDTHGNLILRG